MKKLLAVLFAFGFLFVGYQVHASAPDLIVTDLSWSPETPNQNTSVNSFAMSVIIKNIGDVSVILPENMALKIVMNGLNYGGFSLGTAYYNLNPGDSQLFDFHTTQDPNILANAGTFDITAKIDDSQNGYYPQGLVNESNENNNSLTKQIIIKSPGFDSSTCAISSFTVSPREIVLGNPVTISWAVTDGCLSTAVSSNNLDTYIGPVSQSGSRVVYPKVDTLYGMITGGSTSVAVRSEDINVKVTSGDTKDYGCSNGQVYSSTTGNKCSIINAPICPANMPNPGSLCSDGKIEAATKDANNCTTSYRCTNPRNDLGCKNNEKYSSITKQTCPMISTDNGCAGTNKFSSTTGAACLINTPEVDGGCNGINKYSLMTGKLCSNFTGVYTPVIPNTIDIPINRTLKLGIKGDDVKALQAFLNLLADGSFGPKTQAKVMEWQAAHGLTADGSFGRMSREKAGLTQ